MVLRHKDVASVSSRLAGSLGDSEADVLSHLSSERRFFDGHAQLYIHRAGVEEESGLAMNMYSLT